MKKRAGSASVNGKLLRQLCDERGWNNGDLLNAIDKAGETLSERKLDDMMASKTAKVSTIKIVADVLNCNVEVLFAKPPAQFRPQPFEMSFNTNGVITSADQAEKLATLIPQWIRQMEELGLKFEVNNSLLAMSGVGEHWGVLLLFGKNYDGDKIYSFLKIYLKDLGRLKEAIESGMGFNPADFGTVIEAGHGEPDQEIRRQVHLKIEEQKGAVGENT